MFGLFSAKDLSLYRYYNKNFLDAIKIVSGKRIIIDSSKYAARALALSECDQIDLSIVWLTRSPAGLMDSFRKQNNDEQLPKSPWGVVRYYIFVSMSTFIASIRLKEKVVHLRYEDLLNDPKFELCRISDKCGVNLDSVIQLIEAEEALNVGHLVTGNRLRKSKQIKFYRKSKKVNNYSSVFKIPVTVMNLLEKWIEKRTYNDRKE